jgi:prephenate dehydratase
MKVNEIDDLTGRKIVSRRCMVYGNGLSRSATLVLAKQHNEYNQIQRITSFPEVAACCRRLLFSHFADEEAVDDGSTTLIIPRYNSQQYQTGMRDLPPEFSNCKLYGNVL